jgi:hypothetical protein
MKLVTVLMFFAIIHDKFIWAIVFDVALFFEDLYTISQKISTNLLINDQDSVRVQKTGIVYHPQRIKVSIAQRVKVNHPQRIKVNH